MGYLLVASRDSIPIMGHLVEDGVFVIGKQLARYRAKKNKEHDVGALSRLFELDGIGVENEHASLTIKGDQMVLERLNRKASLYVNKRLVKSTLLKLTDTVAVGPFTLKFVEEGQENDFDLNALKARIHNELVEKLDLSKIRIEEFSDRELWQRCSVVIDAILGASYVPEGVDKARLKLEVLREALGLGPLEQLLAEKDVSEIMVNSKNEIWVERKGKLQQDKDLSFTSDEQVINVIGRIVAPLGRRIDESSPLVDARLKDGSRVNAIIPPLALRGPSITIRKFPESKLTYKDLVKFGSMTDGMAHFLQTAVEGRRNIVIAGGTGSGKTTLLNVLSNFIPPDERVVTMEDSAELKLYQPNLVSLESRPSNIEGKGAIPIRDLVKNALRMRPDRIIVGECRSGETLDMLQAMNTGHDGSLTTLHANTPEDATLRIETMVMMAGFDLPIRVIRMQIASAVHLIVQQNRLSDGSRRVMAVSEVAGVTEQGEIALKDIFRYIRTGFDEHQNVTGYFTATGYIPRFIKEFERMGMKINRAIFEPIKTETQEEADDS